MRAWCYACLRRGCVLPRVVCLEKRVGLPACIPQLGQAQPQRQTHYQQPMPNLLPSSPPVVAAAAAYKRGRGRAKHTKRGRNKKAQHAHINTQTKKHGAVCLFHYLLSTTTNRLQPSNVGHVVCCRVVPPLRVTQQPAHVSVAVVALPPCVYSA